MFLSAKRWTQARFRRNRLPDAGMMGELKLSRELRKLGLLLMIAPSSNGKTADSGSAYRGSNPCGAAQQCEVVNAKCELHIRF